MVVLARKQAKNRDFAAPLTAEKCVVFGTNSKKNLWDPLCCSSFSLTKDIEYHKQEVGNVLNHQQTACKVIRKYKKVQTHVKYMHIAKHWYFYIVAKIQISKVIRLIHK